MADKPKDDHGWSDKFVDTGDQWRIIPAKGQAKKPRLRRRGSHPGGVQTKSVGETKHPSGHEGNGEPASRLRHKTPAADEVDDPDPDELADLIADILGGIYGDEAIDLIDDLEDAPEDGTKTYTGLLKGWSEIDHPRGPGGKFIAKHSAEARSTAGDAIKTALKAPQSPEGLKSLTEHLSILTVAQLRALKKEHGLSASPRLKAELVAKLAARLHEATAANKAPEPPPPEKHPVADRKKVIADALRGELGDKADAVASAAGLSLDKHTLALAIKNQGGLEYDAAEKLVPAVTAKIVEHLEEHGIPVPAEVVEQAKTLTAEEMEVQRKEEQDRWNAERAAKVAAAKVFAEANWKKPPPPESVTSQTWIAIRTRQQMVEVAKDLAKIKALADKGKEIEKSYGTSPDYYDQIHAWEEECKKPGNKRLFNKYRSPWMNPKDKQGVGGALMQAESLAASLAHDWSKENYLSTYSDHGAKAHAEHMEAVKEAAADLGHDLSEEVVKEFIYESWLPQKYRDRSTTKNMQAGHANYMEDSHDYANALLQQSLALAAKKTQPLMDRAAATLEDSLAETATANAAYDEAIRQQKEASKIFNDFEESFITDRTALGYSMSIPDDQLPEWERLYKEKRELTKALGAAVAKRDAIVKGAGHKWLDGLLPEQGNDLVKINGGTHLDPKSLEEVNTATAFLKKVVSAKWGKMPVEMEPLGSTGDRANQSNGKIRSGPSIDASTIIHEYGHLIEEQHGNTLGTLSKAFAMQAVKDSAETPQHMGAGYEAQEIGARDGFLSPYTGKYYAFPASEVLSMGVQQLYDDPVKLFQESPDHFRYTLAALHGMLT